MFIINNTIEILKELNHNSGMDETMLEKKVTRKEFLILIGAFILFITGISSLFSKTDSFFKGKSSTGFGNGPYGGYQT